MALRRVAPVAVAALAFAALAPLPAEADQTRPPVGPVFTEVRPGAVEFAGFLYFTASTSATGWELFRTDGTQAGTTLVKDFNAGSAEGNPGNLTVVGNRLYLNATPGPGQNSDVVFYLLDTAPTTVVGTTVQGAAGPGRGTVMGSVGSKVLIGHYENNLNYGLYGLATGSNFTKISSGFDSVDPTARPFGANLGGWFYYRSSNNSGTPDGAEVWKTDGTTTAKVKEIAPAAAGSDPVVLGATSDRVYFTASAGSNDRELYATDGTSAGTQVLTDDADHPGTTSVTVSSPAATGSTFYFVNSSQSTGDEPWKSAGTAASTQLVKDVDPGPAASASTLASFKGGFAMLRGSRVYYSNGTANGTVLLTDKAEGGFGLAFFTPASGGRAYFAGGFNGYGGVVWRTDGTPAGTLGLTAGGFDPPNANGVQSASYLATLDDDVIFFGRTDTTSNLRVHLIDRSAPDLLRANTVLPTISAPVANTSVNATKGTWTRDSVGTKYEYQWLLDGVPIPGGASQYASYYTDTSQVGRALSVRVTATGIGAPNVVVATSAAATITAPPQPPGNQPPVVQAFTVTKQPAISGKAKVGKSLSVSAPGVAQPGAAYSYRWLANGAAIPGATGTTLKLKGKQKGKKITVQVTVAKAGYTTLVLTAGPTGKVKAKPPKK